jgi:hypothetical protein
MKQTMEERFKEFIENETMIDYRIAKDFLPFFRSELALRDQELLEKIEEIKAKNYYFECDNCNSDSILTDVSEVVKHHERK